MKRKPVPEVSASAFCVTLSRLRTRLTSSPSRAGVYRMQCYRSGMLYHGIGENSGNIPERESFLREARLGVRNVPDRECQSLAANPNVKQELGLGGLVKGISAWTLRPATGRSLLQEDALLPS